MAVRGHKRAEKELRELKGRCAAFLRSEKQKEVNGEIDTKNVAINGTTYLSGTTDCPRDGKYERRSGTGHGGPGRPARNKGRKQHGNGLDKQKYGDYKTVPRPTRGASF